MAKYDARADAAAIAKMVRFHVRKGNCGNAATWLDRTIQRQYASTRKAMKKSTITRLNDMIDLCYVKHDPRGPGADSVVHRRLRAKGLLGRSGR